MNLTPKQEAFCLAYLETGNASEAYRRAYNSEKMKPETINNKAHAMLKRGDIGARIADLRSATARRHQLTIDDLIRELEEARAAALTAETVQSSAAVAASMAKAKLLGYDRPDADLEREAKRLNIEKLRRELGTDTAAPVVRFARDD